ncbi:phosphatase PAP2 family protein [Luteibacter yeojuensis]|uniref:phosphatase PAP2 family protein n=1 Tax=Luteibacter yeojuensis TaxID=345309 RepID=UPI0006986C13|nr:phosphatase PAP2 family protein [Luteibacter yeojuensis]
MWHYITCFGDSALLLPLITWTAIVLALAAPRRDAVRWLVAAVACGGTVAFSKLVFMAWGIGPPGLDYTGISGHTALSLFAWPSLAAILFRDARWPGAWLPVALGFVLGLAVGVSRLALEVHSVSEVLMGAVLGTAVATWFIRGLGPSHDGRAWRTWSLAGGVVLLGVAFYGRVFPSQHLLQDIAMWLSGHTRVFTRRLHGLG